MSYGHGHSAGGLSPVVTGRMRCTQRPPTRHAAQLDAALAAMVALRSEAPDPARLTELVLRRLRNAGLATALEPPS